MFVVSEHLIPPHLVTNQVNYSTDRQSPAAMHVLVVNDDGPPSQLSSPYIHSFIHELNLSGVTVSVVLPHIQRSWIGKAHLTGRGVTPTYFRPGTLHADDGTTHSRPRTDGGEEWVLIDSTPASCAQIGLHHYFKEKGPVDLVVSGPNYGRNSTALLSLSSGTIGGAMEGAVCGKRSIALSFAFQNRSHDPVLIRAGSLVAVRLIKYLYDNWTPGVDLYSVNVPLVEGVGGPITKILYTNILQNYWRSGSSFKEVDVEDEVTQDEREMKIRKAEETGGEMEAQGGTVLKHKEFVWAPVFSDIHNSVDEAGPGNDGWVVGTGNVSVTPLKANFMHFDSLVGSEIKLGNTELQNPTKAMSEVYAVVDYEDAYVRPRIVTALKKKMPGVQVLKAEGIPKRPEAKVLYWSSYEKIPFEDLLAHPSTILSCSYIIRKALIRKHHLSTTIRHHTSKHPASILASSAATTCELELDYVEYLDEALAEAYELRDSLEENESKSSQGRQWWILKPGMSDRGQGIRLFSTLAELEEIFREFEGDSEEGEGVNDENGESVGGVKVDTISDIVANSANTKETSVITSQLRHFVAQTYIHPPLVVHNRKFHIRTYVMSVGGLKVYVYKHMLALFAAQEYVPPWEEGANLSGHLTNTCLQTGEREGSVQLFWELAEDLQQKGGSEALENVWEKIKQIVGEVWDAAARGMRVHFQTLPNAFEIFGVDFLIDAEMGVFLLEVNSYPDFKQTGAKLGSVIDGLFEGVVEIGIKPFFEKEIGQDGGWRCVGGGAVEEGDMVKVLDVKLGNW